MKETLPVLMWGIILGGWVLECLIWMLNRQINSPFIYVETFPIISRGVVCLGCAMNGCGRGIARGGQATGHRRHYDIVVRISPVFITGFLAGKVPGGGGTHPSPQGSPAADR